MDRAEKKAFKELEDIVQEQGNKIVALEAQVEGQGRATEEVIRAGMDLREEETSELAAYKGQNRRLIQFVEAVAASHSKFGKEARQILGIS